MRICSRFSLFFKLVATATILFTSSASAQSTYPEQVIKIIVPFTAGGVVDSTARIIGDKLAQKYDKAVIVENKSGASGAIGTEYTARAKADGYTLLIVTPGHAILPSLTKSAKWDPTKDFRAVQGLGEIANVLVVHPDLPVDNVQDFVELAKKRADNPLSIASPGVGTSIHLAGALFAQQAQIELNHVPYRGQPDAISDLLAGRVDVMPLSSSLAASFIESGKLKGLAVTSSQPTALLPEIPTLAQAANLPDYQASTWFGLVTQTKVPDAIIKQLSADIIEVMAQPDVKEKFTALGMDLTLQNPEQFDLFIANEYDKWQGVIQKGGLEIQ